MITTQTFSTNVTAADIERLQDANALARLVQKYEDTPFDLDLAYITDLALFLLTVELSGLGGSHVLRAMLPDRPATGAPSGYINLIDVILPDVINTPKRPTLVTAMLGAGPVEMDGTENGLEIALFISLTAPYDCLVAIGTGEHFSFYAPDDDDMDTDYTPIFAASPAS